LSPLSGYERYCEPEISHIYISELTDSSGHIYLHGFILGEADMDPGEGSHILTENKGRSFILKLDRDGSFLWVRQFDADINGMVLDKAGNLIVIGDFWGEVDFDPGEGRFVLSADTDGMYFLSLNPAGNFIKAVSIENAYSNHFSLDSEGNLYVSGSFYDIVDFDPGVNSRILRSEYGSSFIMMLQEGGDLGWVSQFETYISTIAPDEGGNLYFKGTDSGDVIGKLDSTGHLLWEKRMQETYEEGSMSVSKSGRVMVCGEFQGRIDFDPGPDTFFLESEENRSSVFVMNLDPEGNFLWARNTHGGYAPRSMADISENIVLAGFFTDSLHVKTGGEDETLVAEDMIPNIFLLHFDQEGQLLSTIKKIIPCSGSYSGSELTIHTSSREQILLSGTVQEEDANSCMNSMAFLSWLDGEGNMLKEIIIDLEGAGDPFENNDQLDMAAYMDDSQIHSGLTISRDDDDWYDLTAYSESCNNTHTLFISCLFDHSEGDLNMELVTAEGSVIAISMSETDNEQIMHQAYPGESLYLHVYLKSGSHNNYTLSWEDACYLEFPDPRFLSALIDEGVDRDGDSLISLAEAWVVSYLDLEGKDISDMSGIGSFIYLDSLDCSGNQLNSLDLRDCERLISLNCSQNQLTHLNVSDNRELAKLSCHNNQLSNLLITDNKELQYLDCSHNQLESLYLVYNEKLMHLDASGNLFDRLNLVLNPLIGSQAHSGLLLSDMPSLDEVCVRELPFPPATFQGTLDTTGSPRLSFQMDCRLDSFVYIPDLMFRKALLEERVDDNRDSLISLEEARLVSYLDVYNKGISDLTGIEAFVNLEELNCQRNKLVSLDLSANQNLTELYCSDNELANLDISQNDALRYLYCQNNLLDSLNVSQITGLVRLNCSENLLDTLDVSGNTELTGLYCSWNQLSSLDISNNSLIRYLECDNNLLTSLDLSSCPDLYSIYCDNNHLTHLNLPDSREFKTLNCDNNNLKILDLSGIIELRQLDCSYNLISMLDLSYNSELEIVRCEFNQIDSLDITYLDVLTELSCNDNILSSLVISGCYSLAKVKCHSNQLSSLDLRGCPNLRTLECEQNKLSSLDVSGLNNLARFYCAGNQLSELDVSENAQLYSLDCSGNLLTSLDLSSNTSLSRLYISGMPDMREVCVWQLPFPPEFVEVSAIGSPDVIFENRCGSYVDRFEENDQAEEAAYLEKDYDHQDLIVTEEDEDWYLLNIENPNSFGLITVECHIDSTGGDIVLELMTPEGNQLASSQNVSGKKFIEFLSNKYPQLLLRVRMDSGYENSYSLYWNLESYKPFSDLSVCMNGSDCSQVRIDPEIGITTFTLDSLNLELFSGDRRTETLEISNHGPGSYPFYSALDCSSIRDSLNKAISLNGTDAHIQIPRNHALDAPERLTIEAWIRNKAGESGSSAIISKGYNGAGYELYVTGDTLGRRIRFKVAQADIQSEAFLKDNQWYHVAATYANQSARIYINGILDKVQQIQGSVTAVNQDLFIGSTDSRFSQEYFYPGEVDEVRIWNKVRAPEEIHACMHRELSGEEEGLIGYWPFNLGTRRVVIGHASGNNGVMIGGAERISSFNPVVGLISWFPETGIVPANSTLYYKLEFDAAKLRGGDYFTTVEFISNNPSIPDMRLPTRLRVTEAPSFSLQPDSINLGEVEIYRTHTRILQVINQGSMILKIDSARTNLVGSRISPASATLEPGESKTFKVEVFQRNSESFYGSLTFYTNDPNSQVVEVPISGEGTQAAEVAIQQQIDATLQPESQYLRIMGFENTKTIHGLTLYASLITYHLPEGGNNLMLEADSLPKSWIRTSLPELAVLPPLGVLPFNLILESYSQPEGDYYADIVLEYYNPFYLKGYITIRMHVESTVGTQQESADSGPLLIYPNPTQGPLFIRTADSETEHHISISSINGVVAIQKSFSGSLFRIDLSDYPKGIYVVSVRSRNKIMNRKIILH